MYCILPETNDPYLNLAVEEYLLKNRKEDFLLLGINNESVIIGKHQTAHQETDTKFVFENKIPVIRRITGGGTVFHDPGNLNFTFISQVETGKQIDFQKYTRPVIDFLASRGIDARLEGKSDIRVKGLKISGNAEHVYRNRVLHHGTLLYDSSLDSLKSSIRKDYSCYSSRGVNSNPSSVTNLKGILSGLTDINDLREKMIAWFLDYFPGSELISLRKDELIEAEKLAASKYKTWEWNYAYGPEYHFTNSFLFEGKNINCRLYVKEGTIREFIAEGSADLQKLTGKLMGIRHMPQDVHDCLVAGGIDIDVFSLF